MSCYWELRINAQRADRRSNSMAIRRNYIWCFVGQYTREYLYEKILDE